MILNVPVFLLKKVLKSAAVFLCRATELLKLLKKILLTELQAISENKSMLKVFAGERVQYCAPSGVML